MEKRENTKGNTKRFIPKEKQKEIDYLKNLKQELEGKENVKINLKFPQFMPFDQFKEFMDVVKENRDKIDEIHIPEGGNVWASKDGKMLMHKNGKTKDVELFVALKGLEHAKIPEGVQEVSGFEKSDIVSVEFPDSIKKINFKAFANCKNLEEVKLPEGTETIANSAFQGCESLKKIEIPEKVEAVGNFAFNRCKNLKEVKLPENLKSIGKGAFSKCESLNSVEIGKGIESIGELAFDRCKNLSDIKAPEEIKEMKDSILNRCVKTREKDEWMRDAFEKGEYEKETETKKKNNGNPEKKNWDDKSPEEIVMDWINNSEILKKLDELLKDKEHIKLIIKNAVDVSTKMYKNLMDKIRDHIYKIDEIHIPEGGNVWSSKDGKILAYKDEKTGDVKVALVVKNIDHAKIPDGVTEVSGFAGSDISSVEIPDSVRKIGESAFEFCKNLKEVTIPKGVEEIKAFAFYGCEQLEKVNLPDKLKKVGDFAFSQCESLKEMEFPESLKKVGAYCFELCQSLKRVVLDESVVEVDAHAFDGCENLTKSAPQKEAPSRENLVRENPPKADKYNSKDPAPKETASKGNHPKGNSPKENPPKEGRPKAKTTEKKKEQKENVTEKPAAKSKGVSQNREKYEKILNQKRPETLSFAWMKNREQLDNMERLLKEKEDVKIEIFNHMNLSYKDFCRFMVSVESNYEKLNEIHIPEGGNVFSSEDGKMLMHRDGKTGDVDLVFVLKGLKHAKIPEGVSEISAFRGSEIESVEFPDSVKKINDAAFENCKNLKEVKMSDNIEHIGDLAFKGCTSLENVSLPKNMKTLGVYSFADCKSLKTVEMDENIELIGSRCFEGCKNLSDISLPDGFEKIKNSIVDSCLKDASSGWNKEDFELEEKTLHTERSRQEQEKPSFDQIDSKEQIDKMAERLKDREDAKINVAAPVTVSNDVFQRLKESLESNLDRLDEIHIPEGGNIFSSKDGKMLMHRDDKTGNVELVLALKGIRHAKIPEGVNTVSAFKGSEIESVEFPDSVKKIGDSAFEDCKNLKDVKMPDSIEEIGNRAFKGCKDLEKIKLPENLKEIGFYAFAECHALENVQMKENIDFIGIHAFQGCEKLSGIEMPEGFEDMKEDIEANSLEGSEFGAWNREDFEWREKVRMEYCYDER